MNTTLFIIAILATVCTIVELWMLLKAKKFLARYSNIKDIEGHHNNVSLDVDRLQKNIEDLKSKEEIAHKSVDLLRNENEEMENTLNKTRGAFSLQEKIDKLNEEEKELRLRLGEFHKEEKRIKSLLSSSQEAIDLKIVVDDLKKERESIEESIEMQSFGLYRIRFGFDSSDEFKKQVEIVREKQKDLTKNDLSAVCATEWTVEGSRAKGRQMTKKQIKLMLRAFNGECDAAIAKVRYNNVNNLALRIEKSFAALNKLGESNQICITNEYLQCKIDELQLNHELKEKIFEEKEEQKRIKDAMREEERAEKEIEKAQQQAAKDSEKFQDALERVRKELEEATGRQTDKLATLVTRLENELKGALERKARALSRAQLTKSGHVYIISNIGSFGERVYKIGMTRRLEPLDRVKELGDASVPFRFDVHAMIYTEDASALESVLHKHFHDRRLNKINLRREFFHVTLDELKKAVAKFHAIISFVEVPEAEEYRKTIAINEEYEKTDLAAG